MERISPTRAQQVLKLATHNPWYLYERCKEHFSSLNRETEVKSLVKDLKV